MKLYCATSNPGKLREFQLAAGAGWEFVPLTGIPPCEETGETFADNAVQKAAYYSRHVRGLLFAEDSGLEVNALGGAPGVRSARFAGIGASDADNNRLLIEKLRGVSDRSARYVCVIAVAEAGNVLRTFRGEVAGKIIDEPRGTDGFGYDPYFFLPSIRSHVRRSRPGAEVAGEPSWACGCGDAGVAQAVVRRLIESFVFIVVKSRACPTPTTAYSAAVRNAGACGRRHRVKKPHATHGGSLAFGGASGRLLTDCGHIRRHTRCDKPTQEPGMPGVPS